MTGFRKHAGREAAEAARKDWLRDYMREYMRKRRARQREEVKAKVKAADVQGRNLEAILDDAEHRLYERALGSTNAARFVRGGSKPKKKRGRKK